MFNPQISNPGSGSAFPMDFSPFSASALREQTAHCREQCSSCQTCLLSLFTQPYLGDLHFCPDFCAAESPPWVCLGQPCVSKAKGFVFLDPIPFLNLSSNLGSIPHEQREQSALPACKLLPDFWNRFLLENILFSPLQMRYTLHHSIFIILPSPS